jgi:2'-5' RNA ligase
MLPEQVQQDLAALSRLFAAHRDVLRVVHPEALHFTLRFLGEQTADNERLAAEACAAAAGCSAAFPLIIGGFGAFPNLRRPNVIWLGVLQGDAELCALARQVDDELRSRRVVRESERFTPHLTLARVRPNAAPAALSALAAALPGLPVGEQARSVAAEIALVHSTLTAQGSRYAVLGRWPLQPR